MIIQFELCGNYEDLSVHELDEVDELIADIVERDAYSNLEFKL